MKLTDLPSAGSGSVLGGIEVSVRRYMPRGVLFVFTDGKALIRALDDEITEIREIPCASSVWLGGWYVPPVPHLAAFQVKL